MYFLSNRVYKVFKPLLTLQKRIVFLYSVWWIHIASIMSTEEAELIPLPSMLALASTSVLTTLKWPDLLAIMIGLNLLVAAEVVASMFAPLLISNLQASCDKTTIWYLRVEQHTICTTCSHNVHYTSWMWTKTELKLSRTLYWMIAKWTRSLNTWKQNTIGSGVKQPRRTLKRTSE